MWQIFIGMLWMCLYWYYVGQIGNIEKGLGKRITAFSLAAGVLVISGLWQRTWIGWLAAAVIFLLYDLFYDEEPLKKQWWRVILPGLFPVAVLVLADGIRGMSAVESMAELVNHVNVVLGRDSVVENIMLVGNGVYLFLLFLLLAGKREYLNWKNALCVGAIEGLLSAFMWFLLFMAQSGSVMADTHNSAVIFWGAVLLEILVFFLVEGTLFSYKKGFEHQTETFQREVLSQQYQEIRQIYLNMRGWRHDYHNHLQVMKAQLTVGSVEEMKQYLDELEHDLNKVDTYIKSGNLMIDAILNGKLSIAETKEIKVNCKADLPEQLPIDDVDICVILGNLLDNAIEACEQIPADGRFLRIYMVVNKSQLYISIQNSAKEELNFNEKNYITNKRGNHGFGMKRVKAMVDKYDGFLNLANEPGIFAAEISMPM